MSSTIKDRHDETIVVSRSFKDALVDAAVLDIVPEFGVYFDVTGKECHSTDAISAIFTDDWAHNVAYEVTKLPKYGTIDVTTAYLALETPTQSPTFNQIVGRFLDI